MFSTGLKFEIEPGWEVQIRGRSSMGAKRHLIIPQGVGTIDSDYRGEVFVPLFNIGDIPQTIRDGDRIAQAIVTRVEYHEQDVFEEVTDELSITPRGVGGFGSTGV